MSETKPPLKSERPPGFSERPPPPPDPLMGDFPSGALVQLATTYFDFFTKLFPKGLGVTIIVSNAAGVSTLSSNVASEGLIKTLRGHVETLQDKSYNPHDEIIIP